MERYKKQRSEFYWENKFTFNLMDIWREEGEMQILSDLKLIYLSKEVLSVAMGWGLRFLVSTSFRLADLILPLSCCNIGNERKDSP